MNFIHQRMCSVSCIPVPKKEREAMIIRLSNIDRRITLEEELCDFYPNTIERLKSAGIKLRSLTS